MTITYIKEIGSYRAMLGKRVLACDISRLATLRKALARLMWIRQ